MNTSSEFSYYAALFSLISHISKEVWRWICFLASSCPGVNLLSDGMKRKEERGERKERERDGEKHQSVFPCSVTFTAVLKKEIWLSLTWNKWHLRMFHYNVYCLLLLFIRHIYGTYVSACTKKVFFAMFILYKWRFFKQIKIMQQS